MFWLVTYWRNSNNHRFAKGGKMRNDTTRSLKLIVTCAAAILVLTGVACRSTKQPTANKAADAPPPAPQVNANVSPFNIKESVVIERTSPFNHNRVEHQTKTK